jgi:hypothetical protein
LLSFKSTANNLAMALDFSRRNLNAPTLAVAPGLFGTRCPLTDIIPNKWDNLAALAQTLGLL